MFKGLKVIFFKIRRIPTLLKTLYACLGISFIFIQIVFLQQFRQSSDQPGICPDKQVDVLVLRRWVPETRLPGNADMVIRHDLINTGKPRGDLRSEEHTSELQ